MSSLYLECDVALVGVFVVEQIAVLDGKVVSGGQTTPAISRIELDVIGDARGPSERNRVSSIVALDGSVYA